MRREVTIIILVTSYQLFDLYVCRRSTFSKTAYFALDNEEGIMSKDNPYHFVSQQEGNGRSLPNRN